LNKRFTDFDSKWEERFTESESRRDVRVSSLENAALAFDAWKPTVDAEYAAMSDWKPRLEASAEDLKLEVTKLHKAWDRVALDRPHPGAGILEHPTSASASPSAATGADGPDGHRVAHRHRDLEFGKVSTHTHVPVKGMPYHHSSVPKPPLHSNDSEPRPIHTDRVNFGRLPKLHFPSFDGLNPKPWISPCENYFEMYYVPTEMWIRVAGHYCTGSASRWLQSVEKRLSSLEWQDFCSLLLDRFGRDEHDQLIRQLLHIRQTGTVPEYVTQFAELIDQLAAYESNADPRHYTMKFIDGVPRYALLSFYSAQKTSILPTLWLLCRRKSWISRVAKIQGNLVILFQLLLPRVHILYLHHLSMTRSSLLLLLTVWVHLCPRIRLKQKN